MKDENSIVGNPFCKDDDVPKEIKMENKICPLKCYEINGEYYCWEGCAWYFESAKMCSITMIANGINKEDKNGR